MKNKKKIAALAMAATALIGGAGFAYFSDYDTQTAAGVAGTLGVKSTIDVVQEDLDNLNPGDKTPVNFSFENTGNKLMQTRDTLVLTVEKPVYGDNGEITGYEPINLDTKGETAEFELLDEAGKPVQKRTVAGNKITYVTDATRVLDGKEGMAARETATGEKLTVDGKKILGADKATNKYTLAFRDNAGNEWQGVKVKIDYLVEGAQYLNNETPDWKALDNKTIEFGGDPAHSVVAPRLNK